MRLNTPIAIFTILLVACSSFHGFAFRVPTNSMAPTVKEGDSVVADIFYYKHSPVQRGDIVVVKDPDGRMHPSSREEMYVKRIVGIVGDKIQIKDAKVYVNDQVMSGILGSGKYETDYPVDDFVR